MKIEIGQSLFVVPTNRGAKLSNPTETTVISVGRKCFEVNALKGIRFVIDDLFQEPQTYGYTRSYKIYLNGDEYHEEIRINDARKLIIEKIPLLTPQYIDRILNIINKPI